MAGIVEMSYGKMFKTALKVVNPVKKLVIKTECRVHKFINNQSVIILKNDGHYDAWVFFSKNIRFLNSGVAWADQDLKSSNHFYSPEKSRGLYGSSNALKECMAYYSDALTLWHTGDAEKSIFYLGAACHMIQDMTVPQHVNIKLLKHHRKYEQWVIRVHENQQSFKCFSNGIYLNDIESFILNNARVAIDAYDRSKSIENLEGRFFDITNTILCQAQRSTAGLLNKFYKDVCMMEGRRKECTA